MATLTVYPDPGSGGTTCDGLVARTGFDETLATIRTSTGNVAATTGTTLTVGLTASTTTDQWNELDRSIMTFDTSPLGAQSVISSATLSLYGFSKGNTLGNTPAIHIASASPNSNNNLVSGDYTHVSTTSFGNVLQSSFNNGAYNDFTLNAAGISNISLSGISRFSTQTDWDINNSFTGTWVSGGSQVINFRSSDQAGTSQDPQLTITYTPPPYLGTHYYLKQGFQ